MLITSKTFPNWEATKTNPKQSRPKATARNFETFVALASFILVQQKGLTKSSKHIAASEFRPLDTVLNYTHKCMITSCSVLFFREFRYLKAPLNIPATNRPGIPGMCPSVSITNKGKSWSGLLTNYSTKMIIINIKKI